MTTILLNRWYWAERLKSSKEKMWLRLAWMMPRSLVYWCAIRLICHATQDEHGIQIVPELTAMDALKCWEK